MVLLILPRRLWRWKEGYKFEASGLYYKHVTIVNDDSSIVSKWSFKLIDDPRVIIYDHHRFIIQATGVNLIEIIFFVRQKARPFYNCKFLRQVKLVFLNGEP